FQIVRARLTEGGVFSQWVQLYQLPVAVVTGIVRNLAAVFPHVEIWFSSPGDVMVLGSARPLTYDRAWLGRLVGARGSLGELGRGDSTLADTALGRLVRTGRDPGAWLLSGLVATRRGQSARAAALLTGALAAGADTAEARAGLAVVAARAKDWARAAADARAALVAARGTLRHPYPREWLGDALTRFALEGPPGIADSLIRAAVTGRDGWSKLHEFLAV